jgi:hypothetical protein
MHGSTHCPKPPSLTSFRPCHLHLSTRFSQTSWRVQTPSSRRYRRIIGLFFLEAASEDSILRGCVYVQWVSQDLSSTRSWNGARIYTVWPRARERMQFVKIRVLVDMVGIVVRNFFAHDTRTVHSPQTRSISGYGRRGVSPSTGGSGFRRRSGVNTIPRDVSRSVHPPVLSVQN